METINIETAVVKVDERGGHTSASNAPADALCPGRHLAQRGLPDVETEDSNFGTQIHEALKLGDPKGLDTDQLSIYEGCEEITDRLMLEKFGMDAGKVEKVKERRFWWRSGDGKLQHSGQVDLLSTLGTEGLLIEYKTLPGEVEGAATNEQLRDQVAMAAGSLKLKEIDVAVVQPLVTYKPVVCRYDVISIARAQIDMVSRVKASNDPSSKRVAGTAQCKYCKARFTCKEYHAFVAVSTPVSMSSLVIPVDQWTPSQRALFCERLPIAQKWLEECKAQLKKMLKENPEAVPGWKLGQGRMKAPINNPNELHSRFIANGGNTEQFLACVSIGKGDLEKQVREFSKLKGRALKAKIDEMLAGIVDEKRDEPSLEEVK